MSDQQKSVSLEMFRGSLRHDLGPDTQAALSRAILKLETDLRELGIEVVGEPDCDHSLSDDGLFTLACSECGLQIDSTPDRKILESLINETMETHGTDEGVCELDEEALGELLGRAMSESVLEYAFPVSASKQLRLASEAFASKLGSDMEPLGAEFSTVIEDNFSTLVLR
jgi:hypothetical protein